MSAGSGLALPVGSKQSTIKYIIDYIPDAKRSILGCLLPSDAAAFLHVVGHALTHREKARYLNPLAEVMERYELVKNLRRAGLRIILVGRGIRMVKLSISDPKKYWALRVGGPSFILVLLFRDSTEHEGAMWKFCYDERNAPSISPVDHMVVRCHMTRIVQPEPGAVAGITLRAIHSRLSFNMAPPTSKAVAVVFNPDVDEFSSDGVLVPPFVFRGRHFDEKDTEGIPWVGVVEDLMARGGNTIGRISYATPIYCPARRGADSPASQRPDHQRNIVLSDGEDNWHQSRNLYFIPIHTQNRQSSAHPSSS